MRAFCVSIALLFVALLGIAGVYLSRASGVDAVQPQVLAATLEVVDATDLSVLDMINQVRVDAGVEKISFSGAMKKLASNRVQDMSTRQYYSHKNPDGQTFGAVIQDFDPNSNTSCENLQLQVGDNWQEAVSAWVKSPAHYRCLTNPKLTRGAGSVSVYDEVSFDDAPGEQMSVFAFIATN